jgi:hypothetical protein
MSLPRTALRAAQFLLSVGAVLFAPAFAQEQDTPAPSFPSEPVIAASPFFKKTSASQTAAAAGPVLFSIGDPTDEEQLYLELINRARADANAEAKRLIALDDTYVQSALQKVNTNQIIAIIVMSPMVEEINVLKMPIPFPLGVPKGPKPLKPPFGAKFS